ncbi:hypothetical protein D3C72_1463210 [compost metagenome]
MVSGSMVARVRRMVLPTPSAKARSTAMNSLFERASSSGRPLSGGKLPVAALSSGILGSW